jgi:peptidyl-prolyl cis-trans isomerase SurA
MDLRRISTLLRPFLTPLLASLALLAVFATPIAAQTNGQDLDQIVVVVNKQVITALDLQRRERFLTAQIKRNNQAMPDAQTLSNAVLERAVMETLMLQQAGVQGLIPSDDMVQQTIADNALQSGLDLNRFISRIEQSGVSAAEYTADLKNDMALTSVREKALQSKLKITDAEVDRFLKSADSGIKQEYQVQALFVAKADGASSQVNAQRREQAMSLLAAAKNVANNAAFAALQNSVANTAAASNVKHTVDLGYSALDKLPELYSNAVENMAVGETSSLLESSAGYYIVRLSAKRTINPQVQQTKVRHLLLRVPNPSDEAAVLDQIKRLHDRLTLNIDLFPTLARQFGQDGSASVGGDLGWAMPGDMVPEFERMMDVLKEGEMALPLRTQFGWHLLQVIERKTSDLPQDRLRARAKNLLRARKQDDALTDWLDQLKSQAYIEYKR